MLQNTFSKVYVIFEKNYLNCIKIKLLKLFFKSHVVFHTVRAGA